MTVQEIMERVGSKDTSRVIAYIKDAINVIQSNYDENTATWKTNIVDGTRDYPLPANLVRLLSVSVKDTNDKKYKRIRRMIQEPVMREDTDPE
tara:strand:+ start:4110 stop:4388 length:279 start_codon:yes stop_codon:yes gene_type:complete